MRYPVFEYDWRWNLSAPPADLWPLASDTDRFNEDTGLPPVEDARAPGEELASGRRRLRFSVAGMAVEWVELPFEWVQPRSFGVVRRYSRGPLDEMRVRAELSPDSDGGTDLRYQVTVRPSNLFGLVAVPLGIGLASRSRFGRAFREYAELARQSAPDMAGAEDRRRRPGVRERHGRKLVERGVGEEVAAPLVGYVLDADARALQRIRPYALAELWDRERRAVLSACLHATRTGLLDLHWDILCPLCRGAKERRTALRDLSTGTVHCDTCLIDFSVDLDRAVEVTFRPTPSVRDIEEADYCVAGPQITPHVAAQLLLKPGEERTVRPEMDGGRHRMRSLDATAAALLTVDENGAAEARLRYGRGGWSAEPDRIRIGATLTVENASGEEALAVLERTAWTDTAATAAEVTALQEFRDLFSAEVLATGEFLSVGSLGVLFTDLKASTRMYERMGDAPAYGRVREHFSVLREAISPEAGSVVKTIGDAVMAVFRSRAGAVRALIRAQRALEAPAEAGPPLVLKAGLHFGPCLTVTMNERLDYFGTTVNIASRLTDLSQGGDVVTTDAVVDDPEVRELLEERGFTVRPVEAVLPGLESATPSLHRLIPTPGLGPDGTSGGAT